MILGRESYHDTFINISHRKFHLKFMDDQGQEDMVKLARLRMNMVNGFDCPEVTFPFDIDFIPHGPALSNWTVMTLDEFWSGGRFDLPILIPQLPRRSFDDLNHLFGLLFLNHYH